MKNMERKNIIRLFYIIPFSFLVTFGVFTYRYMWFSVETISMERWLVALMGGVLTSMLFINELD